MKTLRDIIREISAETTITLASENSEIGSMVKSLNDAHNALANIQKLCAKCFPASPGHTPEPLKYEAIFSRLTWGCGTCAEFIGNKDTADELGAEMVARWNNQEPDIHTRKAWAAIERQNAEIKALRDALAECVTESGAAAERSHAYAMRRIASITEIARAALKGATLSSEPSRKDIEDTQALGRILRHPFGIAIHIEGGCVREIVSSVPVEIVRFDFDTEGADADQTHKVTPPLFDIGASKQAAFVSLNENTRIDPARVDRAFKEARAALEGGAQ